MSYNARRVLTSRKRKETDPFHPSTSSKSLVPQTAVAPAVSGPNQPTRSSSGPDQQPLPSNRLLAGYMAFEFLTKGTLLGQHVEPAQADAQPVYSAESKRNRPTQLPSTEGGEPSGKPKPQCYADVASLLRSGEGAHIPGVVNPTQLARWIQM